jgi:hypothetical protein
MLSSIVIETATRDTGYVNHTSHFFKSKNILLNVLIRVLVLTFS